MYIVGLDCRGRAEVEQSRCAEERSDNKDHKEK